MVNRYRFISGYIFLLHLSFSSEIHQSIRIFDPTAETINIIGSLGIPLDHITGKPGVYVDLTVKDDDTIELLGFELGVWFLLAALLVFCIFDY